LHINLDFSKLFKTQGSKFNVGFPTRNSERGTRNSD